MTTKGSSFQASLLSCCNVVLWVLCLLLVLQLVESNAYDGENFSDQFVLQLEKENPCEAIKRHCKSLGATQLSLKQCTARLSSTAVAHFCGNAQLIVDERLFNDCDDIVTCADNAQPGPSFLLPNHRECIKPIRIVDETLSLLDQAVQSRDAMAQFVKRRAKVLVYLSDVDKFELYRRAILLLPNNSCIVDQFGLSLMYLGREDLARKVYTQAVDRHLWDHPLQRPLFQWIPGLRIMNKKDLKFISILESGFFEIKEELLHNLEVSKRLFALEEHNVKISIGGKWTELRLKSSEGFLPENSKLFPNTIKYIKACGEDFLNIKFSALQPGTHIRPHTGPSNRQLRLHLTLIHTGGARMRIGTEWHYFEEGKVTVFDSSWEHEVYHDGNDTRVVLILDMWHPDVPQSLRIE